MLAEEGLDRATLGREAYLDRMWAFMNETRDAISLQLRRLGASADWTRNRFTMDEAAPARCGSPSSGCGTRATCIAARRWSTGARAAGPRSATSRTSIATRSGRCGPSGTTSPPRMAHPARSVGGRGHHPARDPPRRRGGRGPSRRRAVPGLVGREAILRSSAAGCDHRRRGRRPGVRHRGGQDHPAHDPDDYETGKRHGLPPIPSSTKRRGSTRKAASSPAWTGSKHGAGSSSA